MRVLRGKLKLNDQSREQSWGERWYCAQRGVGGFCTNGTTAQGKGNCRGFSLHADLPNYANIKQVR
jgi:hypothetical protein